LVVLCLVNSHIVCLLGAVPEITNRVLSSFWPSLRSRYKPESSILIKHLDFRLRGNDGSRIGGVICRTQHPLLIIKSAGTKNPPAITAKAGARCLSLAAFIKRPQSEFQIGADS
jgi:hypothetical protein